MADVVAVRIPQENVNDEIVTVMLWHVRDGQIVEAGQPLAEVETSKAAFDVPSPSRGVVKLVASAEREIPVGEVLCYVGESPTAIETWLNSRQIAEQTNDNHAAALPVAGAAGVASRIERTISIISGGLSSEAVPGRSLTSTDRPVPTTAAGAHPPTTRFSRPALEYLHRERLEAGDFAGRGLVRLRDIAVPRPAAAVSAHLLPIAAAEPESLVIRGAAGVPTRAEKLSRAKRLEARLLTWSTQKALRSAVVATVTTTGRSSVRKTRADGPEILAAALIHETARLLKKYPALNAYCSGEEVHFYEQVNVGYALDAGQGLKVPVFHDANAKSIDDLVEQRRAFVNDYLDGRLRPEALSGGTFSITDLSGSGVFLFEPLIVEAQAAILGVGSNFLPPDNQAVAYNLVLAFDHRLVEGRTAARFVNELKERMLVHEEGAVASDSPAEVAEPSCSQCGTTVSQARQRKHFLVPVADDTPGQTRLVCTTCLQGR